MTMFDDLHDPQPPTAGMREFARVTTRARAIRRRRAQVAVWATTLCMVGGSAGGVLVSSDSARPRIAPAVEPTAPADDTTVGGSSAQRQYSFADAEGLRDLPPIDLGGGVVEAPTRPGETVQLSEGSDGGICLRVNGPVSTSRCIQSKAGFAFITSTSTSIAGTSGPVAESSDETIVVVAAGVDVAFTTIGTNCQLMPLGGGVSVHLWTCTRLDPARAYVRVVNASQIVIGMQGSGG
ncbi:MAG: hypothetical protein ABI706_08225 [Ilumatobacteraceae bacterium]